MKTAFYIDNSHITINCSCLVNDNPGIGGTEYLFLTTLLELQKKYTSSDNQYILLLQKDMLLPTGLTYQVVGSKSDAISYCTDHHINQLVVKYEEKDYCPNIFMIGPKFLKIIVWAHNVIPRHSLNIIARTPQIGKIVNVSREQLDLYRDNKAFLKSTYIYNSVNVKSINYYKEHSTSFENRKQEVTYLGSLVYPKGFHILAKIWPRILQECPNAHLNVIGSGTLYGDAKLGKYGIAEESYETSFMPYLTDNSGEILPSVTFWGKLGKEKTKVLARTKVGVPNPLGLSETFCLSAVEMELYGARIVTRKYVGYLDTVPLHSGCLCETEEQLALQIITELKRASYPEYQYTYNFIKQEFDHERIIKEWSIFLSNIESWKKGITEPIVNANYNYKHWREWNRKIKSKIPFGYQLPTIDTYINILNKLCPTCNIKIMY